MRMKKFRTRGVLPFAVAGALLATSTTVAQAQRGPGTFASATARAGAGFVVNASFAETGLLPGTVSYQWTAHMYVVVGCKGKSATQMIGVVTGNLTASAGGGTATRSFNVGMPTLTCSNGATPSPVKMVVRSIKITDKTNHLHTKIIGWYVSKAAKGITSAHPFGGPGSQSRGATAA